MSDKKLKIGDIVYLKSGSPKMTVTQIIMRYDGSLEVDCEWILKGGA